MKKRRCSVVLVALGLVLLLFVALFGGVKLTPVLALPTQGKLATTLTSTDAPAPVHDPQESPHSGLPGPSLDASSVDIQPSAMAVLESTCPVTMTGPIWWDTPPQYGSILILPTGEQIIQPGPEDEVRVIIELEDAPVAVYKLGLRAAPAREASTDAERIRAYAESVTQSHRQLLSQLEDQGIPLEPRHEYDYLFNGIAGTIKMADMERIAAQPGVKGVYPDYELHTLLNDSVPLIGANQVWAMTDASSQPVTGRGIRVAVVDTGIDYTHPDLGGCFGPGCKVVGGYDFVNGDADPMDDYGHGTHCAGIIAANGVLKGVAPEAKLYAYKVCNQYGSCPNSAIIAGLERAADPDGDPSTDDAVDVINVSLGGGGSPNDALAVAVDAAVEQGIVVAVSAGNSGSAYQTVLSPGVARKALTVGASEKSDAIASWSSRGPVTDFWELIKPDVVAPGVTISSTVPASGGLGDPSRYRLMSGTSMAAPHIAGCAALLKQLHPSWTPAVIKANLMNTAKDLGLNVYVQGAGRVQVNEAARARAVLEPGSIGFGLVDVQQALWTRSATLRLTNVSTATLQYSLQVSGTLPAGVATHLRPVSVTLAAGQSVSVTLAITVDNALLPYATQEPGSYEARVVAQPLAHGGATALVAERPLVTPFAFIKSPQLRMTFDEGPYYVYVHDGTRSWLRYNPGSFLSLLLPQATYDVWVIYNDLVTWVIREGIVVSEPTDITIHRSDARHTVRLAPHDQTGQAVSLQNYSLVRLFSYRPSPERALGFLSRGTPPLYWRFSDVSTKYAAEWRLDGAWKGAYYEFNDRLIGISDDSTYQNNPADLWHIRHQSHPAPVYAQLKLCFYLPYG